MFDGVTSVWGVVIALLAKGSHSIIVAALGLAIAAGVGMGAGEYLGDESGSHSKALAMAAATVIGTVAPIAPYFFMRGVGALILAILITLALCGLISYERNKGLRGYLQTYGILAIAGGLTAIFSLLTGSGG